MRARIGILVAFAVVGVAIAVIAFGWIEGSMRQSSSTHYATPPATATSSGAAGPPVTLSQYNAISNGMTLAQVQGLMGFPGHVTEQSNESGITGAVYTWTDDRTHAEVIVTFMNSAVTGKAVVGL